MIIQIDLGDDERKINYPGPQLRALQLQRSLFVIVTYISNC